MRYCASIYYKDEEDKNNTMMNMNEQNYKICNQNVKNKRTKS